MRGEFFSSSSSLLRCLYESYIRGLWVWQSATESEIEVVLDTGEFPKLSILDSVVMRYLSRERCI
ncbi:DUF6988 family protein [Nitrosomonas ureae]